ncbi:hypothetical protein [Streptomyces sp. NPDC086777]|uniref:hypothetical protein n=1 Tax=Streptomyces sp. NPDC086777 TaxID=3154866 RepID=UPI00344B67D9
MTDDRVFSFGTFGFPPLDARVVEFRAPAEGVPGRRPWTAKQDGRPEERLDVLHGWLVEDLPGGRVRILTQETRNGEPAAALAGERPNPMLNGHQARLDGLVRAASEWPGPSGSGQVHPAAHGDGGRCSPRVTLGDCE